MSDVESVKGKNEGSGHVLPTDFANEDERRLAELGHVQQLHRQYSLFSLIGFAVVSTNSWAAVSGTLAFGIYDGGLPSIIWGFFAITPIGVCLGLSIAELASAYPVSGGAYHWASVVAGPKYGPALSFITAWLNQFSWILGVAGICATLGQETMALANLINGNVVVNHLHIFAAFQCWNFVCAFGGTLFNKALPYLNTGGVYFSILSCFVIAISCLAKSETKLSAQEVFVTWENESGFSSAPLAFFIGLLNTAYGYTSLDTAVHVAEEVPNAASALPKAIMATVGSKLILGFVTCFFFLISVFFSIQDYDGVLNTSTGFPLAEIFRQACGSKGGIALMVIYTISNVFALPDTQVAASRLIWTVARDGGTPFSRFFSHVDPFTGIPVNAQVFVWLAATALGALYLGSATAFNALIGSCLILSQFCCSMPIMANLLQRRKNFERGPFSLGPVLGFTANIVSVIYIYVSTVFWCFPYDEPVTVEGMNYTAVIISGAALFSVIGWYAVGRHTWRAPGYSASLEREMKIVKGQ
ncbi:amino acid transporter [Pseudohyphozyma bogoriensis]|nr:amino acid transporter [Pseudohyphozyma bogoriensis]